MGENGWFVACWMYAEMIISALIGRPLKALRWTVRRFPRATLTLTLGVCGVLIAEKIFSGQADQRVLSFALIVVIVGFTGMIAVMATPSPKPMPESVPSNHDNWFHD